MSVSFRFGWVDAGPSPDTLSQVTMATLSVEAGGATVTSVLNRKNRIYSDEVVVPLFSVAEWLVTNWWHIWYEVEDTGEQRPEFESRHNLSFAGDGFVLPHLTMTPASGRMRLGAALLRRVLFAHFTGVFDHGCALSGAFSGGRLQAGGPPDGPPAFFGCPTPPGPRPPGA